MSVFYIAAQCGDYAAEDYPDHTYLSSENFVPAQDSELERRICENHKKHTWVSHYHSITSPPSEINSF